MFTDEQKKCIVIMAFEWNLTPIKVSKSFSRNKILERVVLLLVSFLSSQKGV